MTAGTMIRTRLAPSPTGMLHVGTLRTALYAYLIVKKQGGSFYLRIEDTDQKRSVEGAVANILNTLHAVGLDPDEGVMLKDGQVVEKGEYGPYVQSERLDLYQKHVQTLLEQGKAYHCFCTPERLEVMRKTQMQQKKAPMYDRHCLGLSAAEIEQKKKEGEPVVIRQKVPRERKLEFHDLVRGKVIFDGATLDDHVLMKSDGFPTYHLAHVVDDHLMQTNLVIRGEEWLPSLPKHVFLFEDFGWEIPEYAHLPLLLNSDRSKLSKRQGDVAAEDYIKKGYLPAALLNFVAFLGWNPGTEQEIFSLPELVEAFSLDRVHKAGAVFNIEKLNWYNQHYIRELESEVFVDLIRPYLIEAGFQLENYEAGYIAQVAQSIQGRLTVLSEAPEFCSYFLKEPEYSVDLLLSEKMKVDQETAKKALQESITLVSSLDNLSEAHLQEVFIKKIAELGLKNGQVLWPVRAALTGVQFSPGVFEMVSILGKEKAVQRMEVGVGLLAY